MHNLALQCKRTGSSLISERHLSEFFDKKMYIGWSLQVAKIIPKVFPVNVNTAKLYSRENERKDHCTAECYLIV